MDSTLRVVRKSLRRLVSFVLILVVVDSTLRAYVSFPKRAGEWDVLILVVVDSTLRVGRRR